MLVFDKIEIPSWSGKEQELKKYIKKYKLTLYDFADKIKKCVYNSDFCLLISDIEYGKFSIFIKMNDEASPFGYLGLTIYMEVLTGKLYFRLFKYPMNNMLYLLDILYMAHVKYVIGLWKNLHYSDVILMNEKYYIKMYKDESDEDDNYTLCVYIDTNGFICDF